MLPYLPISLYTTYHSYYATCSICAQMLPWTSGGQKLHQYGQENFQNYKKEDSVQGQDLSSTIQWQLPWRLRAGNKCRINRYCTSRKNRCCSSKCYRHIYIYRCLFCLLFLAPRTHTSSLYLSSANSRLRGSLCRITSAQWPAWSLICRSNAPAAGKQLTPLEAWRWHQHIKASEVEDNKWFRIDISVCSLMTWVHSYTDTHNSRSLSLNEGKRGREDKG